MLLKTSILSMAIVALMSCIVPEEEVITTPPVVVKPTDPYQGCCGAEAVEFQLEGNLIFIPNLFTPNKDGINDIFKPFFNPKTVKIESMELRATEENKLIYRNENIDASKPLWGWFGKITTDSTYAGRFTYTIVFSSVASGEKLTKTGSACSAVCKGDTPIPIDDKKRCFFPMQYDAFEHKIITESPISFEVKCLQ